MNHNQVMHARVFACITDKEIKMIDCSFVQSDLEFLNSLSTSRQELQEELSKVQSNLSKLGSESKAVVNGFRSLSQKLQLAFEEHLQPPTEIHWKRLVSMGDHDHDMIQTLHSYQKPLKQIEKQLLSCKSKWKLLVLTIIDSTDTIFQSFHSLSNSNRILSKATQSGTFIQDWSNKLTNLMVETDVAIQGKLDFVYFLLECISHHDETPKSPMKIWDIKHWFDDYHIELEASIETIARDFENVIENCSSVFQAQSLIPFEIYDRVLVFGQLLGTFCDEKYAYVATQDSSILSFARMDDCSVVYACLIPSLGSDIKSIEYIDNQLLFLVSDPNGDAFYSLYISEIAFYDSLSPPQTVSFERVKSFGSNVSSFKVNQQKRLICVVYSDLKSIELFDVE
jgi:hypothetical protein